MTTLKIMPIFLVCLLASNNSRAQNPQHETHVSNWYDRIQEVPLPGMNLDWILEWNRMEYIFSMAL